MSCLLDDGEEEMAEAPSPRSALDAKLQRALDQRRRVGTLRSLQPQSLDACIDFFSNDYLGFARSKALQARVEERKAALAHEHLVGATGSRLISGTSRLFMQVEKELAAFYNTCVLCHCSCARGHHAIDRSKERRRLRWTDALTLSLSRHAHACSIIECA